MIPAPLSTRQQGTNPIKSLPCFLRGFNRGNLQLRSSHPPLSIYQKKYPFHLRVAPVILWSTYRRFVASQSRHSDRRFIQHLSFPVPSHPFFLDIIEETYNLEPPLSIYLKKKLHFSSMSPCVVRIVMENTIHSLGFLMGFCLVA
jgi:hypothetical protein